MPSLKIVSSELKIRPSYGKLSIAIKESLRNWRMIETVKSVNDVKANIALLIKTNTNISILKCYNFILKGCDIENSSFLIEIGKIYTHCIHKMRRRRDQANIRRSKNLHWRIHQISHQFNPHRGDPVIRSQISSPKWKQL